MSLNEKIFEGKLKELVKEIAAFPPNQRGKIEDLAKQTGIYQQKLQKSVDILQESLDYLRVGIKYLLFDLEATKRENNYLKKIIDEKSK